MSTIAVGQIIPTVLFASTDEQLTQFSDRLGKHIVLYFYPKDNTPGCTMEGKNFRDAYPEFQALDTEIIGVSKDTLSKHEKFCGKYELPFPLISDPEESLCNLFGVMSQKTLFGKKIFGIQRSTFLIDKEGVLRQEWRKVKISGHVAEVLAALKSLQR